MIILGIYDGHNSGATLIKNGKILKSVEEERFSRKKNHDGRLLQNQGPVESIKFCTKGYINKIDTISLAIEKPENLKNNSLKSFFSSILDKNFNKRFKTKKIKNKIFNFKKLLNYPLNTQQTRLRKILRTLKKNKINIKNIEIKYCNHHLAHIASAYYPSPFSKAIIISLDGKGDDLCGMIALGNKNKIKILKKINYIHSIGHFYSAMTVVCGFRAIKDEGKVTGLSARGKINFSLLKKFQSLIKVTEDGGLYSLMNKDLYLGPYPHTLFGNNIKKLKKITKGIHKYDICRTVQFFTEKIILKLVNFYQKKYKINNLCVSGGIFANVLINKKLYESKFTKNLYVHPAMTDAGLATGSSLFHYFEKNQRKKRIFNNNIYLGPETSHQSELIRLLKKNNLTFYKPKKIEKEIAFLLSKGKVIARYCSSMEYGPRALGNRSILTNAQDINVNEWLNKKLQRSKSMPFAPVVLDKFAKKYFKNYDGVKYCTKFMTIALKVKRNIKKIFPGVVHIDGTARPQILREKDNPKLYEIMRYYLKFSGHSCLLNTSFNLHDEPIVNTYLDAIKSFKLSQLDYMQCENLLVTNNNRFINKTN